MHKIIQHSDDDIIVVDVVLKKGTDEAAFISSFDSIPEVELKNRISHIPTLVTFRVKYSYIDTLESHSSVVSVEEFTPPVEASVTMSNKKVITKSGDMDGGISQSGNGGNTIPLQFYLNSDLMVSDIGTIGVSLYDDSSSLPDQTYTSEYAGENVDIVTMEAGVIDTFFTPMRTQADFVDPDDSTQSRAIPMNWPDLEGTSNNQITNNNAMFSAHGAGVLSVSCGNICGYAKKASIRSTYLSDGDGPTEVLNALVAWHNSKTPNSSTGLVNPTIIIAEYQWLYGRYYAYPIDDIESVEDEVLGTTTKPSGGWGTDFTPFTDRNIYPFRKRDKDSGDYQWVVTSSIGYSFYGLELALEAAWDAGIILINAAGNNSHVYRKQNVAHKTKMTTVSGSWSRWYIRNGADESATTQSGTTILYPLAPYGPEGYDKSIDVAASTNSEKYQSLDGYSNRGPGIDICGMGGHTFAAYPQYIKQDGYWGFFGGTSCAAPTVVGIAACMIEKYMKLNHAVPTPDQVKSMLIAESRKNAIKNRDSQEAVGYSWSNVFGDGSGYGSGIPNSSFVAYTGVSTWKFLLLQTGNGYGNGAWNLGELAGTPPNRAFWNAKGFNRSQTLGKRPLTGTLYPRPRNLGQAGTRS